MAKPNRKVLIGDTRSPIVREMFEDLERQQRRERRRQGTISLEEALSKLYSWANDVLVRKKEKAVINQNMLETKQDEMRARVRSREEKKPRLGRPRAVRDYEKLRYRITALIDLQAGRSVEFIASRLKKPPDAIRRWIDRGMPLEGDYPARGLRLE
jgi:hypothetical protein